MKKIHYVYYCAMVLALIVTVAATALWVHSFTAEKGHAYLFHDKEGPDPYVVNVIGRETLALALGPEGIRIWRKSGFYFTFNVKQGTFRDPIFNGETKADGEIRVDVTAGWIDVALTESAWRHCNGRYQLETYDITKP